MGWAAAIAAVFGVIAILLRDYIPRWSRRHEKKVANEEAGSFGQDLVDGNDIGVSMRLSDEFDRVRSGRSKDTAG